MPSCLLWSARSCSCVPIKGSSRNWLRSDLNCPKIPASADTHSQRAIRSWCPTGQNPMPDTLPRSRKAEEMADTDGLTGIYNRRHLEKRMIAEIDRLSRYEHGMAVLMIDIDYFK